MRKFLLVLGLLVLLAVPERANAFGLLFGRRGGGGGYGYGGYGGGFRGGFLRGGGWGGYGSGFGRFGGGFGRFGGGGGYGNNFSSFNQSSSFSSFNFQSESFAERRFAVIQVPRIIELPPVVRTRFSLQADFESSSFGRGFGNGNGGYFGR
jgi:hypothetical protein